MEQICDNIKLRLKYAKNIFGGHIEDIMDL